MQIKGREAQCFHCHGKARRVGTHYTLGYPFGPRTIWKCGRCDIEYTNDVWILQKPRMHKAPTYVLTKISASISKFIKYIHEKKYPVYLDLNLRKLITGPKD